METTIEVRSQAETEKLAGQLASRLAGGEVITLEGDLGAGKTTFTQALARGLGIRRTVNSPTFTILKQYEGRLPLNHLDVYRLENSEEDLGWSELFYGEAVSVIEWARYIEDELPKERLDIEIRRTDGDGRAFVFRPQGIYYETLVKEIGL